MKKLVLLFTLLCSSIAYGQSVFINEFMATNTTVIKDEDGEYSDWIELYNSGTSAVQLQGYGLSDDPLLPYKWVFPSIEIPAKGFLLVFASDKNRLSGPYLHTNYKISASGETIRLVDGLGVEIDKIPPVALSDNMSYGRKPDGTTQLAYFTAATPGASNTTTGYNEILPTPTFSQKAGFYTSAISLQLSTTATDAKIYYTLDGSEPTASSKLYTGPITVASKIGTPNKLSTIRTTTPTDFWSLPNGEVFKINVVRAKVFKDGALSSRTITNTYLVDPNIGTRYTLPIISISTDSVNLFSGATGIYVPGDRFDGSDFKTANFYQEGDAWERQGHVEFFEKDGKLGFSQNTALRIHGNWSTRWTVKSLRLYADHDDDGKDEFNYQIFPDKSLKTFRRFILRNSGNDFNRTYFRDAMIHGLVRHLGYDIQAYRPSIVFINGEYWGIQNIRERLDQHHLENNYGVDADSIDILERGGIVDEGDAVHYNAMMSFIRGNDIAQTTNYEQLKTRMDVENYSDYWVSQIIINNTDWPQNNMKWWRKKTSEYIPNAPYGHDGRWRWMLYDTDLSFGSPVDNALARATSSSTLDTEIIRALLRNQSFKNSFINKIADQLNTTFIPERVLQFIDKYKNGIAPEIQGHLDRWRIPSSQTSWNGYIDNIRAFASQRPGHMRSHVLQQYNLSATSRVTIHVSDPGKGKVKINTILIDESTPGANANPYPWIGTYFNGVPVQLTAIPKPGYKFVGWSNPSLPATATITVDLTGDASFTALFEEDPDNAPVIVPAPFNLVSGNYSFSEWAATSTAGTYPQNMIFRRGGAINDPVLAEDMVNDYTLAYNLTSGTRVNGLGTNGFSFINTGTNGNLGAAILALKTIGRTNITVNWTGGTVVRNFRNYAIRLQYKVGDGNWIDVPGPVEYVNNVDGHSQSFATNVSAVTNNAIDNQSVVYIRWKYYNYPPFDITGARPQLRVDDISVTSTKGVTYTPMVNAGEDQFVTLPSNGITLRGAANDIDGTIVSYLWTKESGPSVTLQGTDTPDLTLTNLVAGSYVFKLTATDNDNQASSDLVKVDVSSQNQLPVVSVTSPVQNALVATGASITLSADASDVGGNIQVVDFFVNGSFVGSSASEPYNFVLGTLGVGDHTVTARATDNAGASTYSSVINIKVRHFPTIAWPTPEAITEGTPLGSTQLNASATYQGSPVAGTFTYSPVAGTVLPAGTHALNVTFTPTDANTYNSATASVNIFVRGTCTASGSILREYWANISGGTVADIPVNTPPNQTSQINSFETPINIADSYGQRIRGYICPPADGSYTFYISSDDASELSLSIDDNPANKQPIASVSAWTNSKEWTKYASQKSVPIVLQQGKRYYIEALHKEGAGGDNLAVAWVTPTNATITVIPGAVLSPFSTTTPTNQLPTVSITSPANNASFTAPASINIAASASDADGSINRVEFYNGTTKLGEDQASPYTFTWSNVGTGTYSLTAKAIDNVGAIATSAVVNITVGSSNPVTSLIAKNSVWRYHDKGVDLGTSWTGLSYDDASWASGAGVLGYGDPVTTTISFGPNSSSKYPSYYFRHSFDVADASQYSTLIFNIRRDDGAVVYLNGVEQLRTNMPATAIGYTTLAASTVGHTDETTYFTFSIPASALKSGRNVIAVSLHQDQVGSSDVTFDLEVKGELSGANQLPTVSITSPANNATFTAPATINIAANASDADGTISKVEFFSGNTLLSTVTTSPYSYSWTGVAAGTYSLTAKATDNAGGVTTSAAVSVTVTSTIPSNTLPITKNSVWKYHDKGVDLGTAWTGLSYDDASWASGAGVLGYGDPVTTTLSFGPNSSSKYPSYYFRRAFDVADASVYSTLIFNIRRDDGAVVYLNGVELFRANMPATAISYTTLAASTVGGGDETTYFTFSVPSSQLRSGRNVIAVSVHQDQVGSSDMTFDLEVKGESSGNNQLPTVSITSPANNATFTAPATINIAANASDADGTISKVEFFNGTSKLGEDIDGSNGWSYSWAGVAAGTYSLTAKATDNANAVATSSVVSVIVNAPANQLPTVSITSPANNATFTAPATINIAANASDADGTISKVEFFSGNTLLSTVTTSPYSYSWTGVAAGTYSLTAKATDNAGGVTTSAAVSVTVNASTACASGTILQEYWANITGSAVSAIPVTTPPTSTSQLTIFETATNIANNYGQRIRGYICVPHSGYYTFYIASDETSELWLSTDATAGARQKIAYVTAATKVRQWTKSSFQKSAAKWLEAGSKYYIEALHKEANGADHLSVGWQTPTNSTITVIPGSVLSPFTTTSVARVDNEGIQYHPKLEIYPNPSLGEALQIEAEGLEADEEVVFTLYNGVGAIVVRMVEKADSEGKIHKFNRFIHRLSSGVYILMMQGKTQTITQKVAISK